MKRDLDPLFHPMWSYWLKLKPTLLNLPMLADEKILFRKIFKRALLPSFTLGYYSAG